VDPFHQQLARIAFDASDDLGLVLAGGYAISAHQLTSRPSRDLDFATVSTLPLDVITDRLGDVTAPPATTFRSSKRLRRWPASRSTTGTSDAKSTC
jgi:hypothetical protein